MFDDVKLVFFLIRLGNVFVKVFKYFWDKLWVVLLVFLGVKVCIIRKE